MGDDTNHEWPRGYGHAIQCDSMEDVKKKGRTQPAMIEINPDKKIVWSYDGDKNKCLITMDVFE